jgi:hypothetical protein
VISKVGEKRGGRRYQTQAFTEQGVAMLSSVLRSATAVRVNIQIMRAFVRLRRAVVVSAQVMALLDDLSKRVDVHDGVIADIVESIRQMVEAPAKGWNQGTTLWQSRCYAETATNCGCSDSPVSCSGSRTYSFEVTNCDLKFGAFTEHGAPIAFPVANTLATTEE